MLIDTETAVSRSTNHDRERGITMETKHKSNPFTGSTKPHHTPGPWTIDGKTGQYDDYAVAGAIVSDRPELIAMVADTSGRGKANARLISKAWLLPEVIETLKFVADKCGNPDLECYIDNLLAKLTEKRE